MTDSAVLFVDSGIGGLAYLISAREALPRERFLYIADNRFFPYGEKESDLVSARMVQLIGRCIEDFRPKAAVIACNTASVVALSALRQHYDIPFVGVVPAVKPAAERSKGKRIGVFATNRTVRDAYTAELIRNFASDCEIVSYPGSETVSYIEERFFTDSEDARRGYVNTLAEEFIRDGIDALVLGCTHFTFLAPCLADVLKGRVEVLDSREGVTRQLERIIRNTGAAEGPAPGESGLFGTAEGNALLPFLAERFRLSYRGVLYMEDLVS